MDNLDFDFASIARNLQTNQLVWRLTERVLAEDLPKDDSDEHLFHPGYHLVKKVHMDINKRVWIACWEKPFTGEILEKPTAMISPKLTGWESLAGLPN